MRRVSAGDGSVFDLAGLGERAEVVDYHEFLRGGMFSAGVYRLAAGQADPQEPHDEDEIYYVISGSAEIEIAGRRHPLGPGSAAFVAREVEHRFVEIAEDLELLVVFAPPESAA